MSAPKIRQVYVIGCGPAGLAAAHAARGLGRDVVIFAPSRMSPLRGPLLIQQPIPGITVSQPDAYISQHVIGGSILDYRYRLYGDVNINIQGDILAPGYDAWRLKPAYHAMWALYSNLIVDMQVYPDNLRYFAELEGVLVVCTAPRYLMCGQFDVNTWKGKHSFLFAPVDIAPVTMYPGQPDNTIIFNADGARGEWVRSSSIFGHKVTEWKPGDGQKEKGRIAAAERYEKNGPVTIKKPISTDCQCHRRVLFTGRFGAWRNETWIHTAYHDVRRALISDDNQELSFT